MPQYRVEVSPNNRAACKDKQCKDNNVKLLKGELRFATWVEIKDHGSWAYKHWGCVSGQQLQHLQDFIKQPDGSFDFDMIDGYDEMTEYPEFQAKIRTAMIEGKIADEDFNGDPEFNRLGQRGIRGHAKKAAPVKEESTPKQEDTVKKEKKVKKEGTVKKKTVKKGEDDGHAAASLQDRPPTPGPSSKRGRAMKAEYDEHEDDEDDKDWAPSPSPKKAKKPAKRARNVEPDFSPRPKRKRTYKPGQDSS